MDSASKERWWQKKTFWGLVLGIGAHALGKWHGLPPGLDPVVQDLSLSGLGLAGYGAIEVLRSHAAATRAHADALKNVPENGGPTP